MRSILSSITKSIKQVVAYLKPHLVLSVAVLLVGIGGMYYYKQHHTVLTEETTTVIRGDIVQVVKITGSVQPKKEVSLAFQVGGQVSYVGVKVGDNVTEGKLLATLGAGDAQAALLQAQANLENANATLAQLLQGARVEELAVKQQAVDNAATALDQVYVTVPDVIRDVDGTTADVVKNKVAPLFAYAGNRYILSFTSCDQRLQSTVETLRSQIENTLADFQKQNSTISTLSSREVLSTVLDQAYQATLATNELVNAISSLLLTSCSLGNTSLDAYRTTLSSVRTTMSTLFTTISTKRSALISSRNTFSQASRDLELTKAGTDPYRIKGQNALIKQAQAQVASAESGLAKTKIVAPFAGTISDVVIVEGETVSLGKSVISMLTTNAFEVEAKIPEIDITKLHVGAKVEITLDAYGKAVIFPATVTRIDPTATTEGNVPVYKIIVTFNQADQRIKSGMTANLKIATVSKTTLVLPARFITTTDESHGTVTVRVGKIDASRNITLGLRGEDGLIEILSGVQEGDVVVAPTTENKSAQKQTN
jgi:HlyD family secretion protein